ncbi:putative serine dehydratase domain-containing protein [Mrakia frigida]|uniref:D-serine ammonia-lyase DSD1 n=1 Tax=Mrakia frigida TaxID=29902 RepID=UPI003FCC105D
MVLPPQTSTPYLLTTLPAKAPLQDAMVGLKLNQLRTPALIIDRSRFAENCAKMHDKAKAFGSSFRAHVKSHKTMEGTRLQLVSSSGKSSTTIVSTMQELWQLLPLFEEGIATDVLYALPLPLTLLSDLSSFQDRITPFGGQLLIMIDHPDQVKGLEEFEKVAALDPSYESKFKCFVKVNQGGNRAGIIPSDEVLPALISTILASPVLKLFGFYCHAGNAYASTCCEDAHSYLETEVECADGAGRMATSLLAELSPSLQSKYKDTRWVLSVGSTPTAHSAGTEEDGKRAELSGDLELHAGNYPLLDLQQLSTGLATLPSVGCSVISTVISSYDLRSEKMCDAGCIAMSKDVGPEKGLGRVLNLDETTTGWRLGRVSQEHGLLVKNDKEGEAKALEIGQKIRIVPQHACITLAAYPFYYIVDSSEEDADTVVDVWVPWKGW